MKKTTIDKAKSAKRESKYVDFKEQFDVDQPRDWCEIIKDIVAMANSGGGCILIGAKNDGTPSGWDPTPVLTLDPVQITDKIAKYTEGQFADFSVEEVEKNGHRLVALQVHGISIPMVFMRPGTYEIGGGKQHTAFAKGTIYFRHGAKSEPGNSKDLRDCIDREIQRNRKSWLGNIRKVIQAPVGYRIDVVAPEVVQPALPAAARIRIVRDPTVPAYREIDRDRTHPHRQKEVVQVVNQRLAGKKEIKAFDVLCVRKVHGIDQARPEFYYKPKFGSPQYSDAFVDWLVQQYENDNGFFGKAREVCRERT